MQYASRCTSKKFRIAFRISFALVFLTIFFFSFQIFSFNEKDLLAYRALVDTDSEGEETKTVAEQKRSGVCKEIFYIQNLSRLCLKVNASSSILELNQNGSETEIIEKLDNVVGMLQEELFYRLPDGREAILQENGRLLIKNNSSKHEFVDYPLSSTQAMQSIRCFEADSALYSYKDNRLLATQVKVSRYIIPGHTFKEPLQDYKPQMIGYAKEAHLTFEEGIPHFKASQLKAVFYHPESP